MKTHVLALAGGNRGRVGWIKGDLAQLLSAGRTAFMVRFPCQSFPKDMHQMKATAIRAATPEEIRYAADKAAAAQEFVDRFKWQK